MAYDAYSLKPLQDEHTPLPSNSNSVENLFDKLETMRRLIKIDYNVERLVNVASKFVDIDKENNPNLCNLVYDLERV